MFLVIKNILILFALITESLGIGVDYYIDQDETPKTLQNKTYESAARRTLESNRLFQTNTSFSRTLSGDYVNEYDETEDNIILSYKVARARPRLQKQFIAKKLFTVLKGGNLSTSFKAASPQNTSHTTLSLKLNSIEEYDYKYVNDTDDNGLPSLRNLDTAENISSSQNKSQMETPYAKFYNLEPAVNRDINRKEKKYVFDRTWYVPQDLACWDLPILYGELGAKKKKHNIFLIYGGNLANVVESSTEQKTDYKPVEPPITHVVNNWCEVEPCYGDHTLCLFQNKVISNICDKEYKIYVPSVSNQFSLVNTINTMRNHIANGVSKKYPHLPTAANMNQMMYDYDLEEMAEAWLRQCLPGSAPCSALEGKFVAHLECTKYSKYCCPKSSKDISECTPRPECYVYPIIGCIHIWFSSAGKNLVKRDVQCGRSTVSTFNTVQLLWAKTSKIGCAFGERANGDIRVVCNFSPGAPFYLETKLYCGLIAHKDIEQFRNNENLTDIMYLASLGVNWHSIINAPSLDDVTTLKYKMSSQTIVHEKSTKSYWGVDSLVKLYEEGWVRKQLGDRRNGTKSMTARLVAKYTFIDESESRCDSDESIYVVGTPGSMCVEKGRTYHGLCYDFRDPTPGYRLIAIIASIALFSLILYDLFSGVVRQTNN